MENLDRCKKGLHVVETFLITKIKFKLYETHELNMQCVSVAQLDTSWMCERSVYPTHTYPPALLSLVSLITFILLTFTPSIWYCESLFNLSSV